MVLVNLHAQVACCHKIEILLFWGMAASAPPPLPTFFCRLLLRSIIVSVAPPVILGEEEIFAPSFPSALLMNGLIEFIAEERLLQLGQGATHHTSASTFHHTT